MRIVGLLALTIFFPVFAHAAPPALTTYTISHDTIYPAATAESGLATTTAIDIAFSEQVKVSIKIVSASGATVKSLYSSSSVTNPDKKIWDGTNTAGAQVDSGTYTILISATSTVGSLIMTDSSKTVTVASSGSISLDSSSTTLTTTTPSSLSSSPPEYIPIPALRIITSGSRTISSSADTAFTAVVYDGKGNKRDDATVTWSFGDGMRRIGASVFHSYYSPGEYIVVVRATTSDGGDTLIESVMTVKDVSIKIASVSTRGIALANNSSRTLDLSLWRLSMGGKEFKIPTGTQILAGRTTLLPSQIIDLPVSDSAFLLYPSGEIAASYPETLVAVSAPLAQPFVSKMSSNKVQTVEPVINTKTNIQTYEKAVLAPTAATEIAAVGAAFPASPVFDQKLASVADSRVSGIFSSPWTLGFLGVMVLAGATFILF